MVLSFVRCPGTSRCFVIWETIHKLRIAPESLTPRVGERESDGFVGSLRGGHAPGGQAVKRTSGKRETVFR